MSWLQQQTLQPTWNAKWLDQHRTVARGGLKKAGLEGFMEVQMALSDSKLSKHQRELLEAAEAAQIHWFGWPIAVVLSRDEFRPRPRADGIVAKVAPEGGESYDYWALRRDGDFYLLQSLFEDRRRPGTLFVDIQIKKVTETLLYANRLYTRLGAKESSAVVLAMRHCGLRGRVLTTADPARDIRERTTGEDEVETQVHVELSRIEPEIVRLVRDLTSPLFMVFDFFELSSAVYKEIIDEFVAGRATA